MVVNPLSLTRELKAMARSDILRIVILLFLCLFFSGTVHPQDQRKADSIKAVLHQFEDNDSLYLHLMGRLAYHEQNSQQKKEYAQQLIRKAKKAGSTSGLYNGYYYLGGAHGSLGDHSSSLEAYLECLKYTEDSLESKSEVLNAIGDTYARNSDYDNALHYYNKSIKTLFSISEPNQEVKRTLAIAYNNAGDTYFLASMYDSALLYFEKARKIFDVLQDEIGIAFCLGNIGLVQAEKGNNQLAEKGIQKAVDILKAMENYNAVSIYYRYMVDIYLDKGEFQRALQYARESYQMAHSQSLKEQIKDASLKLYELHKQSGNHKQALDYFEEHTAYKDSIVNKKSIQEMADLRTEYEVSQKQAEVDLLTIEKRNQQIILWTVAGFAFLLVVLAFIIWRFYKLRTRINKKLAAQKRELERLNETKDTFFSIISHDLRGPLSSLAGVSHVIKLLVQSKQTDELLEIGDQMEETVQNLSSLLDNLLNWATQQRGHVPNVPEKIDLYTMTSNVTGIFTNMLEGKQINLQNHVTESIEIWADKNMVHTILRNLISNAVKFTPENGTIEIQAHQENRMAALSVKDSGVGMSEQQAEKLFDLEAKKSTYGTSGEKGLGLGLQLVKEFLTLNNGDIKIESAPNEGSVFTIYLPLFEEVAETIPVGSAEEQM